MNRPIRLLLVSLTLATTLAAQDAAREVPVQKIVAEATERGQVMTHLKHLTTEIGPRLTGSDLCVKACEWAKTQFESWGLKASLDEWNAIMEKPIFNVGFNRGPWTAKMTEPEVLDLVCTTQSWSPGTDGAKAGPAILAPKDADAAAALADRIKGAWIIGRTSGDVAAKCEELGAHGFVRSAGGELIQGFGSPPRSWEAIPTRVNITLLGSQHKKIVALLEEGKNVQLSFDIKNEFVKGPIKCYNVIADLVGSEKPDEYVVVGGHIDSWDGAQGCTDNGTGTSTTLEAARILSAIGAKPKRTIRFMLWSGEEQGLLGSASWCRRNRDLMPKISACFVHDMGTNYLSGLRVTEKMMPIFEKICEPLTKVVPDSDDVLSKSNKDFPFKLGAGYSPGGGSDHVSFFRQGVPAFFWNQDGRVDYGRGWHTQHDKYNIAVPEYQQRSSMVIAMVALGVANLDEMLPRDDMNARPARPQGGRRLGIRVADDGVTVDSVTEGSVAEQAGVKAGDKVVKIAGKDATNADARTQAIQDAPRETTMVVLRDGKELELKLVFPEAPAARRQLGVYLDEDATITGIVDDTPAAQIGLQEGDRIIKMGDTKVADQEQLRAAIAASPKETTVTFVRDGKEQTLKVTFPR